MSYFIESLNNSIRKMLLSLFHWWGNWSSKRLSDSPKVTQLVSKVVWRPNKANSGKHSLYFVVWRPISWLRGVLGVEGCYSGLRGWWRPGKWKGQSWAMFWRAVAERGSSSSWGYKNWLLIHKNCWLSLVSQEASPLSLECPLISALCS